MLKKFIALLTSAILVTSMAPSVIAMADTNQKSKSEVFFDDFNGNSLDTNKWLIANKAWGGQNGGVVKENVSVSNGTLKLEGHGLNYTGNVKGTGKYGDSGKLVGAAVATRDYYASGSYEVVAKIAPNLGACSAMWTFEYEEYYEGDEGYIPELAMDHCTVVNHEIDIEIPTAINSHSTENFHSARFNTWTYENVYTPHFMDVGVDLDDGNFHTYRFDWHTGDASETARVEFYIDNQLLYTCYKTIPTNAGRFWIGVWFPFANDTDGDKKPDTGWAGRADFDTTVFEIDSVKITPYNEAGDTAQKETYGYDGWAPNSFPELFASENYEHIVNGDFSNGSNAWTLGGSATISNGKAILTSGDKTDTVSQIVNASPSATYTLTVDIETDGTAVTIGASKANGTKNQTYTVTKSGKLKITFNNEAVNTSLKVYARVERWQDINVKVSVDNISLKGANYVPEMTIEFIPADGSAPITPSATPTTTTKPTAEPTTEPTAEPTAEPTSKPTGSTEPTPSAEPTSKPTGSTEPTPSTEPTSEPTPTAEPTAKPTGSTEPTPSTEPTGEPTPMVVPSVSPEATVSPKPSVSAEPTTKPTVTPTVNPGKPTTEPTSKPTEKPVATGNSTPTKEVTSAPTDMPTTVAPTKTPSATPTNAPSTEKESGVEGFIERLYTVAMDRDSDEAGKKYWVNEVKVNGKTGADLALAFLFSDEFLDKDMNNDQFIEVLYKTFFDRASEDAGKKYWDGEMKNGMSKKDVIMGFINSPEWANICLTYGIKSGTDVQPTITIKPSDDIKAFAERLYTTCLGRDSEEAGLKYWADELANLRQSGSQVAKGFFFSPEFVNSKLDDSEYLTRLYKTVMGREPEKAGFEYWLGEMKAGRMSREGVFDGFAASPEWIGICADYGILR